MRDVRARLRLGLIILSGATVAFANLVAIDGLVLPAEAAKPAVIRDQCNQTSGDGMGHECPNPTDLLIRPGNGNYCSDWICCPANPDGKTYNCAAATNPTLVGPGSKGRFKDVLGPRARRLDLVGARVHDDGPGRPVDEHEVFRGEHGARPRRGDDGRDALGVRHDGGVRRRPGAVRDDRESDAQGAKSAGRGRGLSDARDLRRLDEARDEEVGVPESGRDGHFAANALDIDARAIANIVRAIGGDVKVESAVAIDIGEGECGRAAAGPSARRRLRWSRGCPG